MSPTHKTHFIPGGLRPPSSPLLSSLLHWHVVDSILAEHTEPNTPPIKWAERRLHPGDVWYAAWACFVTVFTCMEDQLKAESWKSDNDVTRVCELETLQVTQRTDTPSQCGYWKYFDILYFTVPVSLWGVALSVGQAVQWDVSAGSFGEGWGRIGAVGAQVQALGLFQGLLTARHPRHLLPQLLEVWRTHRCQERTHS